MRKTWAQEVVISTAVLVLVGYVVAIAISFIGALSGNEFYALQPTYLLIMVPLGILIGNSKFIVEREEDEDRASRQDPSATPNT